MAGGLRRWLYALGVLALAVGLGTAFAPEQAPFAAGAVAVYALGLVGLALAGVTVYLRRSAEFERATVPEPEERSAFTRPGADLDRLVTRAFAATDVNAMQAREHLKERLYPIAVGVVMRRENVSEARAEALIEEGAWTDDQFAARYFAGTPVDVPLSTRLRWTLRGESLRAVCAHHAVDALTEEVVG